MRRIALVAVVLATTALFVTRGRAASSGDHTAPRSGVIDAAGARTVRVVGEAGELRVVGVSGLGEVRVQGTAHASRASALDGVRLELRREGGEVVVRPVIRSHRVRWFGGPTHRSLDLVVEVPAELEVRVTDGSGDAQVDGVGALDITDGSGNLRVSNVRGAARITDSSGELDVQGVAGDLWLRDASGDVGVREVAGSVVVASDGSGALAASGVRGDVLVQRDGSGDIDVSDVGGRFLLTEDGSGEVRHHDVRGGVQLPRAKAERGH